MLSFALSRLRRAVLLSLTFLAFLIFFHQSVLAVEGEITYTSNNTNLMGDDSFTGPFNLGFTFNFYGTDYTQAYININGTVNFTNGDSSYTNSGLNSAGQPSSIFAFWDDLVTDVSPYDQNPIYYATIGAAPNRQFIAQWTNMYFYSTTIQMGTFQVILSEGSNKVQIQYRDLLGGDRSLGNSATIGIKKDSSTYKQYSSETASLVQGQSITYTPNGSNDYTVSSTTPTSGAEVSSEYSLVYLSPEGSPVSPTLVNPPNSTTNITTTPTFEWLPVNGATSYTVLVSTVSNFSSTIVNAGGQTGTSYTLGSPLNTGTTYYWRVQSVNNKGSSLSSTRTFTTGSANTAPNPPEEVSSSTLIGGNNLTSVNGSTLTTVLNDADSDEQVRYRLQIATDTNFNYLIVDYRSPFDNEGNFSYTFGQSGGTYLVGSSGTTLPTDDYYLRIRAEDDAAASSSWYTISNIAFTIVPDSQGPQINSILATAINSNSVTISWSTNEASSTIVDYGLVSSYGFLTSESDISPRVTDHSVVLTNLKPCARYFFRVKSTDGSNNQSVSSNQNFNTSGCATSSITVGVETTLPVTGGTVQLVNNLSTAQIIVPNNYAVQSAVFQINQLDTAEIPTTPTNQQLVTDNFYDLIAVTETDEQLHSFDQPITFTISYGSDAESDFDESTLDVYKYDGTNWVKKDCLLDTDANTLTCTLSSFSVYGVLGQPKTSTITNSTTSSSNSSESNESQCSNIKPSSAPDLFQINTTKNSATLYFTPINNTSDFVLAYSTNPNAEEFGSQFTLAREGVQNFTVNLLKPNTIYYFKIRGQNGCASGEWSNFMKVKTNSQIYYKNSSPANKLSSNLNVKVSSKADSLIDQPVVDPISSQPVKPAESLKPDANSQNSQKCFLWWCW